MQKEGGKKPLDSKEKPGPELRDGRVLSDKLGKKGLREEKQRLPRNVSKVMILQQPHHTPSPNELELLSILL